MFWNYIFWLTGWLTAFWISNAPIENKLIRAIFSILLYTIVMVIYFLVN